MNEIEQRLWCDVYVACLVQFGNSEAVAKADLAVVEFRNANEDMEEPS